MSEFKPQKRQKIETVSSETQILDQDDKQLEKPSVSKSTCTEDSVCDEV